MNRFAAHGMIAEAQQGKRILVLAEAARTIRDEMDEVIRLLEGADPDTYDVRRARGAERISFPAGGCIRFQSALARIGGQSADVVFLDAGVDEMLRNTDTWPDLHGIVRPHGEIVRA